jgi:hypothetical protein
MFPVAPIKGHGGRRAKQPVARLMRRRNDGNAFRPTDRGGRNTEFTLAVVNAAMGHGAKLGPRRGR